MDIQTYSFLLKKRSMSGLGEAATWANSTLIAPKNLKAAPA
jgi:hypothetical protein